MSPSAQARKLALIATLTREEITGWRAEIVRHKDRPFPGEIAALVEREAALSRQ